MNESTPGESQNKSLAPDDHAGLVKYLSDLRDHWEQYHQRKENMAWAATTLYLASITALISILFNNSHLVLDLYSRLMLVVVILLTLWLTLKFIERHFSDRKIAARMVASAGDALSVALDASSPIAVTDTKPTDYEYDKHHVYKVPAILHRTLTASTLLRPQPPYWYGISPLSVILLWTTVAATATVCLPSQCSSDWRQLFWLLPIVIIQLAVAWHAGYYSMLKGNQEKKERGAA